MWQIDLHRVLWIKCVVCGKQLSETQSNVEKTLFLASGSGDRKQKLFPYYIGIRKQFLEVLKLFSVEY